MRLLGTWGPQGPLFERPTILPDGDPGAVVLPAAAAAPAAAPRTRAIVCEFCSCEIGPDGSYKKLSPEAREMRDRERTIETLREELVAAKKESVELRKLVESAVVKDKERGGVRIFSDGWLAQFRKKEEQA